MSDIQIIGDSDTGGGIINGVPQIGVRINGILVAVDGSVGTSHLPCPFIPIHCQNIWNTESRQVFARINGLPISIDGDADTCGHVRLPNARGARINP